MVFRLLLLLILTGILAVFVLQNLSPVLPLVFFGVQFPPLPLAWWILGAIGAGAGSMLAIQILFGLSNFVTRQTLRSRTQSATHPGSSSQWTVSSDPNSGDRATKRYDRTPSNDDATWQNWRGYETGSAQTPSRTTTSSVDDWERPPSDDWESADPQDVSRDRGQSDTTTTSSQQEQYPRSPEATSRDSTYSYSYREPRNTGVGKSEPVVDADYRVIVPPHRPLEEPMAVPPPPPPPAEENADDWFEEPSNDFENPSR